MSTIQSTEGHAMTFLSALEASPITFIWGVYEAYSCFGEIRDFDTYEAANEWRVLVILEALTPQTISYKN